VNLDPQLLTASFEGDRKAQYTLYRACFPVLMSVAMRYSRDKQEALAAVNTGFLKIVQHLDKYKPNETPLLAWIRRVMINSVIDTFRKEKKWRDSTVFPENPERNYSDTPVNWNDAEQQLNVEHLEALIQKLPPMTRQVFNLFVLDGFSHREISSMLDMSEGTSKWHVNQARQQLQTWIKAEMKHP
jgi:RNA polymerase sigma-70 factor (ECF subfamily)